MKLLLGFAKNIMLILNTHHSPVEALKYKNTWEDLRPSESRSLAVEPRNFLNTPKKIVIWRVEKVLVFCFMKTKAKEQIFFFLEDSPWSNGKSPRWNLLLGLTLPMEKVIESFIAVSELPNGD